MGGTARDRAGDGRRDVDGAVPDERRGRQRSACGSGANGSPGYAYAGFQATGVSSGVRATIAADPGAVGAGGPRRGVDRRRRQERRPEGRDDVAPDGRRGASEHAADGLRGDHARRTATRLHPAPPERPGGRAAPAGGARDEPPPGRLARVGRRQADDRPDRPPGLAPDLEADRDRRVVERRRRDVQRLRLPLRAGRDRAVARRLVADVRARLHVRGPRLRRAAAAPRPVRPADALRPTRCRPTPSTPPRPRPSADRSTPRRS